MNGLVEFLRARLDEDEQAARRACEYANAEWHLDEEFGETILWWPPEPHVAEAERRHGLRVTSDQWRGQTIESSGARIAPHIARHDPARVLREVEAKRRIIADIVVGMNEVRRIAEAEWGDIGGYTSDDLLKLLALPYTDHADYRQEWRP